MNRFICCIVFLLSVSVTFAQKVYFIYLETESQQPFFARINDKTHNSSSSGFLILSNLRDSSYTIKIGFPQGKWPEQQFTIPVKSKDRGYLLKNFGEKGWGLFDLQTLSIQMAEASAKDRAGTIKRGGVSAFTEILSKAANDPSLMEERPVAIAKNENKPPVQQVARKEDATTQKEQPAANAVVVEQKKKEDPPVAIVKAPEDKKSTSTTSEQQEKPETELVKNTNDSAKSSGTPSQAVKNENATAQKEQPAATAVVVEQKKKEDPPVTIAKAPEDKKNTPVTSEQQKKPETELVKNTKDTGKSSGAPAVSGQPEQNKVPATNKDAGETKTEVSEKYKRSVVTKKSESSTTDGFGLVFIDQFSNGQKDTIQIMIPNPKDDIVKTKDQPSQPKKFLDIGNEDRSVTSNVSPSASKACPLIASDKDFFNLRKKMAAQKTDEQMINESRKSFKSKCFTTEQIKNLGSLFLNEAGKFQFYEAAYPFSSDRDNFIALQSDFKDNYFIYRFKKLVNEQDDK